MRRRLVIAAGLLSVLLIPSWLATAQTGSTQEKKATTQEKKTTAKEQKIDGTVSNLDTTAHTFTVKLRAQGVAERQVIYSDTTKFTFQNKPAKVEDLKDGSRVIVVGAPNDKAQIVARRIDVREGS